MAPHPYYWLMIDTLHIAGPFSTANAAWAFLEEGADQFGFISVKKEGEESLMFAIDAIVEYDPLFTLEWLESEGYI